MSYIEQVNNEILPFIHTKIQECENVDVVNAIIQEVTNEYINVDIGLFFEDYDEDFDDELPEYNYNGITSFDEEDLSFAVIYILASVYVLGLAGKLDNRCLYLEEGMEVKTLGFLGSMSMLKNAGSTEGIENIKGLSALNDLSEEEIASRLSKNLGITENGITIEEYLSTELYLKDIETTSKVEKETNSADGLKEILSWYNGNITGAVNQVKDVYSELFSSYYEVKKPLGILTSEGAITIGKAGNIELIKEGINEHQNLYNYIVMGDGQPERNTTPPKGRKAKDTPAKYTGLNLELKKDREFDVRTLANHFIKAVGLTKVDTENPSKSLEGICNSDTFGNFDPSKEKRDFYAFKMLEYMYGYVKVSGDKLQKVDVVSWDEYWLEYIFSDLKAGYGDVTYLVIKHLGLVEGDLYQSGDVNRQLKRILDKLYEYLKYMITYCVCLNDYMQAKDEQGNVTIKNVKVRVTDIDNEIPQVEDFTADMCDYAFKSLGVAGSAILPPQPTDVAKFGNRSSYYVIEISHKLDEKFAECMPNFAYVALDVVKKRMGGKKDDYSQAVLGLSTNEKIVTLEKFHFNDTLIHYIIAGSRSGKGVMTLNLLAKGMAMGRPIFYLDNKPDMASMFRTPEMSGGRMFCVNNDWSDEWDNFHNCSPDMMSPSWKQHIPIGVEKMNSGKQYADAAKRSFYYVRAVLFMYAVIYLFCEISSEEKNAREQIMADEKPIFVIDEFKAALDDGFITNFVTTEFTSRNGFKAGDLLNDAKSDNEKTRETALKKLSGNEDKLWGLDFINSLRQSITTWQAFQVKGLEGKHPNYDIFVISQQLPERETSAKTQTNFMWATSGDLYAGSKTALQEGLFMSHSNAFFGYNKEHYEYLDSDTSGNPKTSTILNNQARGFAYTGVNFKDKWHALKAKESKEKDNIIKDAIVFKPFLIYNDADEKGPYVDSDKGLRGRMASLFTPTEATQKFEELKNMHRRDDGVLEPRIGFVPYISDMMPEGADIKATLEKSYTIGNKILEAIGYRTPADGDNNNVIDFIYDLRPEWMFNLADLKIAVEHYYRTGEVDHSCRNKWGELSRRYDAICGRSGEEFSSEYRNDETDTIEEFGSKEAFEEIKNEGNTETKETKTQGTSFEDELKNLTKDNANNETETTEKDEEGLKKDIENEFKKVMDAMKQPDPRSVRLSADMNEKMGMLKGRLPEQTFNDMMQALLGIFNKRGYDDIIIENNKFKAIVK